MSNVDHLFILDPLAQLNFDLDSSLRMARALASSGHQIYVCSPVDIARHSQHIYPEAQTCRLLFRAEGLAATQVEAPLKRSLNSFVAIHMRKDPPYDMAYIALTWILDSAERSGVKVYNRPQALRDINEKLAIFQFPYASKPGLVSSQARDLLDFIRKNAGGDAILKPLTLFGGRGVLRLNLSEQTESEILSVLVEETANGQEYRLIQPFDIKIFEGELRVFTAFGKTISWCLKKPSPNNFLANTRMGATLERYQPGIKEQEMVNRLATELLSQGVYFAGLDIIGGFVSEINITSPRLLQAADDTRDYYAEIANLIIADLNG